MGLGPSLKTWPKWPPQRVQRHSLAPKSPMQYNGCTVCVTAPGTASKKLGQPARKKRERRGVKRRQASAQGGARVSAPVPESNLAAASNSGAPQPAHANVPGRSSCSSGDENELHARVGRVTTRRMSKVYVPGLQSCACRASPHRSVPRLTSTSNAGGGSSAAHSSSLFLIGTSPTGACRLAAQNARSGLCARGRRRARE